MNGVVAAYFWNVLRGEWPKLPSKESFADVRRLYRYVWVLYSLLMTIFGAQQVLRFLFYVPSDVLGDIGRETLVNGIALFGGRALRSGSIHGDSFRLRWRILVNWIRTCGWACFICWR